MLKLIAVKPRIIAALRSTTVSPDRAVSLLIVSCLAFRLLWGATLESSNDESYHYLYTTHPSLSYFDHPPMLMLIVKAGIILCGGVVHPFSIRLGFALLSAGTAWLVYRGTSRWYSPWAGFYAALFLNLSGYYLTSGGFALPDVPFLFFTFVTTWALCQAIITKPRQILPWLWVGLGLGGAMLSKYHAVLLPVGIVFYAIITPGARWLLRSFGPYLALAVAFAAFSPVLIWNAQHEWASFRFQSGRAVGSGFSALGFLKASVCIAAYLFPWVWGLIVLTAAKRLWNFSSLPSVDRLLMCMAAIPIGFFGYVSFSRWILPHWPLFGFALLLPLVGDMWAKWAASDITWSRRRIAAMLSVPLALAPLIIAQGRFGLIPVSGNDPLTDISGWESVGAELTKRGLTDEPHTFLYTTSWHQSGQLAFVLRERVPVLCYDDDARGFAFWSKPEEWVGWNGLLVTTSINPWDLAALAKYFRKVEQVAEFPMTRGGNPFRTVWVYRCTDQILPYPFNYNTQ